MRLVPVLRMIINEIETFEIRIYEDFDQIILLSSANVFPPSLEQRRQADIHSSKGVLVCVFRITYVRCEYVYLCVPETWVSSFSLQPSMERMKTESR